MRNGETSASKPLMNCRKRRDDVRTRGESLIWDKSEGTCLLLSRRPARRRREPGPGSCVERGNLHPDVKGETQAADPREPEYRGGVQGRSCA